MADLKIMGFRTTGQTIEIAMLFQDFFKLHFPENAQYAARTKVDLRTAVVVCWEKTPL